MSYAALHMREAAEIIEKMDVSAIEKIADLLATVKADGGRIFFLGVGGSAGNCSHAVNDFRKIVGIESYAPTDNVSELTARTNDEGWATVFVEWLKISKLQSKDAVFIFSVGGGQWRSSALQSSRARGTAAHTSLPHRHERGRRDRGGDLPKLDQAVWLALKNRTDEQSTSGSQGGQGPA